MCCLFVYLHFMDCLHVLLSTLRLSLIFVPANHKQLSLPFIAHSGASHSHTMYVISSAVKQCNTKLTSLLPARNMLHGIKQPHTPSSMVWLLLLLETVFVCLLIFCEETVQNGVLPSFKCTVCTVCGYAWVLPPGQRLEPKNVACSW